MKLETLGHGTWAFCCEIFTDFYNFTDFYTDFYHYVSKCKNIFFILELTFQDEHLLNEAI